jgi:hypothetical protein
VIRSCVFDPLFDHIQDVLRFGGEFEGLGLGVEAIVELRVHAVQLLRDVVQEFEDLGGLLFWFSKPGGLQDSSRWS